MCQPQLLFCLYYEVMHILKGFYKRAYVKPRALRDTPPIHVVSFNKYLGTILGIGNAAVKKLS